MKTLIAATLFGFSLLSLQASAGTLTITCGKNAYEALEQKDLSLAEFALVLKTRGANNPAEVQSMTDDGTERSSSISKVLYKLPNVTVEMNNGSEYKITDLQNCGNLEASTGDMAFSKYVGGFAGRGPIVRGKCNCASN